MTPQRLELQKHLESAILLACAATRSRSRRSDMEVKCGWLPRQHRTRLGVQDQRTRTPSTAPVTKHKKKDPSRCTEPVGGPPTRSF